MGDDLARRGFGEVNYLPDFEGARKIAVRGQVVGFPNGHSIEGRNRGHALKKIVGDGRLIGGWRLIAFYFRAR